MLILEASSHPASLKPHHDSLSAGTYVRQALQSNPAHGSARTSKAKRSASRAHCEGSQTVPVALMLILEASSHPASLKPHHDSLSAGTYVRQALQSNPAHGSPTAPSTARAQWTALLGQPSGNPDAKAQSVDPNSHISVPVTAPVSNDGQTQFGSSGVGSSEVIQSQTPSEKIETPCASQSAFPSPTHCAFILSISPTQCPSSSALSGHRSESGFAKQ